MIKNRTSLTDTYNNAVKLAQEIINPELTTDAASYSTKVQKLKEYFEPTIRGAIISALLRRNDLEFLVKSLLEMDIQYRTNQKMFCRVDANKKGFVMYINPIHMAYLTFNQMCSALAAEASVIINNDMTIAKESNPSNDSETNRIIDKGREVHKHEMFREEIINSYNNGAKLKEEEYCYNKTTMEIDCGGASISNSSKYNLVEYSNFIRKHEVARKNDSSGDDESDSDGSGQSSEGKSCKGNTESSEGKSCKGNTEDAVLNANGTNNQYSDTLNAINKFEKPLSQEDLHQYANMDADKLKSDTETFVSNVLGSCDRGTIPGGYASLIDKLLKKKSNLRWENDLKQGLGNTPYGVEYTKRKPSRRQPSRFDVPGETKKFICDVVVMIDTSGSVSDEEIYNILCEVYDISAQFMAKITVIECDSEVNHVYTIKQKNQIHKEVHGRGGTAFTPAIDYVNEHSFKQAISIYFTDGYGEDTVPKINTKKHIWVITNCDSNEQAAKILSVENPQGSIRALKIKQD